MSADQAPHTTSDCPQPRLVELMLSLVPTDGSTIGNTALRRQLEATLAAEGLVLPEVAYWQAQATLIAEGLLAKGQGRGGSVRRVIPAASAPGGDLADHTDGFFLQTQAVPAAVELAGKSKVTGAATKVRSRGRPTVDEATQVISYRHLDVAVQRPGIGAGSGVAPRPARRSAITPAR